jgi:hypothetical protein
MYRCLKCPTGSFGKKISCSDKSRQNFKKHIQVLQNQDVHDDDNAVQPQSVKISDEVDRYLADTDTMCDPVRMAAYPTIRQVFNDLNTGLPASAAVERLFSLGGRVFTPLRTFLSSHHFEMMIFLRLSERF